MRIERLAGRLELPLLVTAPANVRYLTGLRSSNAALLVEAGEATLFADFRYAEAARAVDGVAFVQTARDLFADLGTRLAGRRLAFESGGISHADWTKLSAGGAELEPTTGVVEALRAVKEPAELDAVRRAAALSDRLYDELSRERFSGRSERDLAWWIERRFRELGADRLAFDVVVAAHENGARPHATPGERKIEEGTLVVVDAGCVVDGYCSDCTRTFATGEPPAELAEAYALCLRAQEDGLAAIRPGGAARDADAASRVAVSARGFGEHYGHGLGHGVGLEVHEAPWLRADSTDVLAVGNVVTVEPGIYLPGAGGVRIEDLVVVTEDGCERLTTFTKELLVVE